jgi:hypothetical protein
VVITALLAWGGLSSARDGGRMPRASKGKQIMADPMKSRRDAYLDLVQAARQGGFRPVPKAMLPMDLALYVSMEWCDRMFRVPVHRSKDTADHFFHVAEPKARVDLLEHRLTVESVPVQVYEASSFFVVSVPLATLKNTDTLGKVAEAASMLLALDEPVKFRSIPSDSRGAISTNPEGEMVSLGNWSRRIDAVLLDRELMLVLYKSTYDYIMALVSDPGAWFQELRKLK